MTGEHYHEFIKEAFIKPIRSVLIVDDDYPTYDDILKQDNGTGKSWHRNQERIACMIKGFRQNPQPLLVDIHDGTNVTAESEATAATHLHQCDLLVLDYELDKSKPGDGTQAINILRALMSNSHFNLVVIHTNADLDTVFDEVRWGLIAPSEDVLSESEIKSARELIEVREDSSRGFTQKLSDSIGSAQYFHYHLKQKSYLRTMAKGCQPYKDFKDHANSAGWKQDQQKLVLRYLLKEVEDKHLEKETSKGRSDRLKWSSDNSDPKWVRSDSAFVALSSKVDNKDLLSDLQKALVHWNPRPSRLFLTRLRAEIDEHGIAAQGPALSNLHALAFWYHRLLAAGSEEERQWRIAESVSRHSNQLMQAVLPRVEDFSKRLIKAEAGSGTDHKAICKDHFSVDLDNDEHKEKAALEHNALACSMEPVGWHLTTGHVFSISDEYWLCLSPACDMVPLQIPGWCTEVFGERLPFVGVKLDKVKPTTALKHIHSNRFIFLRIGDNVCCYCFNDPSGEGSAPHWQILFAEQQGRFSEEGFQFKVSRIEQRKTRLLAKPLKATVIGQLRYEYALNLIQKFGGHLTRVGLDFTNGNPD